ncbi:hypothetical protein DPMN_117512 [Dreissena polymorpha]|uniref:Uncharacterized protein n=1 Tax=Dreissena polymorpha TaxID=45954 RepID=A0A9D4BYR8_DREPO|nr:hypothetical protein DPMN_073200 [Dreissena polymorpha]KAH3843977.1 hypothetical protein DPMN_117512 [Dreissena polymorpha]
MADRLSNCQDECIKPVISGAILPHQMSSELPKTKFERYFMSTDHINLAITNINHVLFYRPYIDNLRAKGECCTSNSEDKATVSRATCPNQAYS